MQDRFKHWIVTAAFVASALTTLFGVAVVHAQEQQQHHLPTHTLGVFIGDTALARREGLTLGVEYEYRLSARLGIGATAEHVPGETDANVFVLPLAVHQGPWKLYAGPGLEYGVEGEEPLLRVGVEYGFEVGKFEVSPQIDVDFIDGERVFVLGVVFAYPL